MRLVRFAFLACAATCAMSACGLSSTGGNAIDTGAPGAAGGPIGSAGTSQNGSGSGGTTGIGGAGTGGAATAGAAQGGGSKPVAGAGGSGPAECTPTSCLSSQYCGDAGICVPKVPGGSVCTANIQCTAASPYCIGLTVGGTGRCCDQQECGQCHTCGSGVCKVIDSDPTCNTPNTTNQCAANNKCDLTTGMCMKAAPAKTACGTALTCPDANHESGSQSCDGNGNCNQAGNITPCAPYACKGNPTAGQCLATSCSGPDDCATGYFCIGGICREKLGPGEGCAEAPDMCASGVCSMGEQVCCDAACGEACNTCLGSNGHCHAAAAGTDPQKQCTPGDSCATPGCDGTHIDCPAPTIPEGAICAATVCSGAGVLGNFCDGGKCAPKGIGSCPQGFACNDPFVVGTCFTDCTIGDDSHCSGGKVCSTLGAASECIGFHSIDRGDPCEADEQCKTGFCRRTSSSGAMVCSNFSCDASGGDCGSSGYVTPDGTDCQFPTGCCAGMMFGTCKSAGGVATCNAPPGNNCQGSMSKCTAGTCHN